MKNLIAYGKDRHGETHGFYCSDRTLYCSGSHLTELIIPEGVTYVDCCDNQLTELIIPEGVEVVVCFDNQMTHLALPSSVTLLYCDKEVIGLERYVGKVKMNLL